jgi:DUF2075 family protein/DNA replication protein DnaC
MSARFQERLGRLPGYGEFNSWQNSLSRVRDLIEVAELTDNMIALEYEVPYNQSRIDCLLFGKGKDKVSNIVLIELKQWSSVKALEDEGNFVETYTGGADQVVAHPSQQAKGYDGYLKGFVSEFENPPPLILFSCAYCHNYNKEDGKGLFDPVYQSLINDFPVYTKEDVVALAHKIKELLASGDGFEIFNRFMRSPIRPSKKLLENVSKVVKNEAVFSLLNEQLVAKNLIWSKVKKADKKKVKSVIIVHGGPGTGKSVIAINLLAEAAQKGKKVFYGCKSKPFIEGLKKLVGKEGELLFSNLYRFLPNKMKENELDLLLVDEAHRIEKKSNFQYTKPEDKTDMPQIEQLIRCTKTSVFFIDDKQNVRSQEIGSSKLIKDAIKEFDCELSETTLYTQYRCMGSNDYLLWLESVLGYTEEKRMLWKNEIFDFQIFDSPQAIYEKLKEKEQEKPNSARMVAGFCWPWSKELDDNGELVKDVRIGDFAMPWETHGEISKTPKGYVKWYEWAYRPEGFKQVGCIYTAQGFEFDYVGVIIGNDLIYDAKTNSLKADIKATRDPRLKRGKENFEAHVKNIYRTLLTRGMKGCYVYFVNKDVEKYFKLQIGDLLAYRAETLRPSEIVTDEKQFAPRIEQDIAGHLKYKEYLPVRSLKAAATRFGTEDYPEELGWMKVGMKMKLNKDMFVAQVIGKSMEPTITDGSYCVFQFERGGSRNGKVVLVQSRQVTDRETNQTYTVKRYSSEKEYFDDGTWRHKRITLSPDNRSFEAMVLENVPDDDFRIVAEFIKQLTQGVN